MNNNDGRGEQNKSYTRSAWEMGLVKRPTCPQTRCPDYRSHSQREHDALMERGAAVLVLAKALSAAADRNK